MEFFGNSEPGPQFSEYTGELKTAAGVTELMIRVRVQCENGGSENAVFIDNVTMTVVDDSEPVPNPPPSPTEPAEASSSSTYSEPAVTSSSSTTPPSDTPSPTEASSSIIPPPASSTRYVIITLSV